MAAERMPPSPIWPDGQRIRECTCGVYNTPKEYFEHMENGMHEHALMRRGGTIRDE